MKQGIVIALVIVLTTGGAALARQAVPGVLQNGSFEVATADPNSGIMIPDQWTSFGNPNDPQGQGQQSAAYAWDGSYGLLASVRYGEYVGVFRDTITVQGGTRVLMTAKALHPSAYPIADPVKAGMKLEFIDAGGAGFPPAAEGLTFDANSPQDTWVYVSLTTPVPSDPNYATVGLARIVLISWEQHDPNNPDPNGVLTNGPCYADLAWAEVASNPGVNILDPNGNCSFEVGPGGVNGLPPWTMFGDAASGAVKNRYEVTPPTGGGNYVAKFIGNTCGLLRDVPITPGDTITVGAWFYSKSTNPYSNFWAKAGVKVEWTSDRPDNIDVVPNLNPISGTTNVIDSADPTDTWLPISISYTLPGGQNSLLRATLIDAFGFGTADVYFDAFEMVLANDPNVPPYRIIEGADVNADDAEDMIDIAALQDAYASPGTALKFGDLVFDQNDDRLWQFAEADYALTQMTGPATP